MSPSARSKALRRRQPPTCLRRLRRYDAAVLVSDLDAAAMLAVRLINTYAAYEAEPESLSTPEELRAFVRENRIPAGVVTERELRETQTLRDALRLVFEPRSLKAKARVINDLLCRAEARPAMMAGIDEWGLVHEVDDDAPLPSRLAVICGLGLAAGLDRYGDERLKVCEAAPCERVFIDLSKNIVRRHCSRRCANRTSAAAFRARHRLSPVRR
jgi:predicted RNA-binding Zn ribbon-like protein